MLKTKMERYGHRQPKLCGSSLDFEFIRECMKINKIRPKFQFWTKIEIKMTCLVFVFCIVSLPLEPFGSRLIDVEDFELY